MTLPRKSLIGATLVSMMAAGAFVAAAFVGGAFLARSPLLAVTCNVPTTQLGRRVQMAIDHHRLFAPITKATSVVANSSLISSMSKMMS